MSDSNFKTPKQLWIELKQSIHSPPETQKPVPYNVYLIAFALIAGPMLGLSVFLFTAQDPSIVEVLRASDLVGLVLSFVAGFFLFRPTMKSWAIAVFALLVMIVINLVSFFQSRFDSTSPSFFQLLLAITIIISIFLIGSFYRFPYLDRRRGFWAQIRFQINFPVQIKKISSGEVYSLSAQDLSMGGALIKVPDSIQNIFATGDEVEFILTNPAIRASAKITRLTGEGFGIQFRKMNKEDKQSLYSFLENYSESNNQ